MSELPVFPLKLAEYSIARLRLIAKLSITSNCPCPISMFTVRHLKMPYNGAWLGEVAGRLSCFSKKILLWINRTTIVQNIYLGVIFTEPCCTSAPFSRVSLITYFTKVGDVINTA
jgi:hypothetical protein